MQLLVPHDADAQGVDQRVAGIRLVEHHLAADVRQAEAVAVAADAGDDAGQHASGVVRVGRAEPQGVHHRHRPGAHGQDVADDPADTGSRTLVGLDVGRVVVRLDLERDREPCPTSTTPAFSPMPASSLPTGVSWVSSPNCRRCTLLDLYEQCSDHITLYMASSAAGGAAAENLADPLVLVVPQPQLRPGLRLVRGVFGLLDGVDHADDKGREDGGEEPQPVESRGR